MKANEALTLNACLLALLQYGDSVPLSLHEQIQRANHQLASGQPGAVKQLKEVILRDEDKRLERLYKSARNYLVTQSQYGQQEMAKSTALAVPVSIAISNSMPSDIPNGFGFGLIDLAIEILSSPDANYRVKAQQVLRQPKLQKQLEEAPEELKVAAQELSKAANWLHPTKVAIMKKIENSFFILDDVAYSLELPVESAQRYIKSLWNEGYVRPTSGNLLKQIWLSFKGAPILEELPDVDTSLALTAKGHFYLHPGTLGRYLSGQQRVA